MTKEFTRLELFSMVDGRLSTTMDDVYRICSHLIDDNSVTTYGLVIVADMLEKRQPQWYKKEIEVLEQIKSKLCTNDFDTLIEHIKNNYNEIILVPQFKDE